MRFDEYALTRNIRISPVDRLDGLVIEVGLPPDWEPFESSPGMQVWFWHNDPRIAEFGANAVLTTHIAEEPLDEVEVFAMLCEQQVEMVPGAVELERLSTLASEGPGIAGSLAMNIESQFGTIGSVSLSRIITAERQTLIAQLTITALRDTSVDWENIWLYVKPSAAADSAHGGHRGGAPLSAPIGGSNGQ